MARYPVGGKFALSHLKLPRICSGEATNRLFQHASLLPLFTFSFKILLGNKVLFKTTGDSDRAQKNLLWLQYRLG